MRLVIGTRGSRLALVQTHWIKDQIQSLYPDWEIEIKKIKTSGDKDRTRAISQLGGKEIFVKEIEDQLLTRQIDLAVHSMKDLPADLPPGRCLAFVPKRADARDILIMRDVDRLEDLPARPRIGTGSMRRAYQFQALVPEAEIVPIRGNIETRIRKMEEEDLDGVLLASAGVDRLGLQPPHQVRLSLDQMVSSPGQGILGVEMREGDKDLYQALRPLNDPGVEVQARLERQFLKAVGGSCTLPVGAYGELKGDQVHFQAILGQAGQKEVKKVVVSGKPEEDLGLRAAAQLQALWKEEEKEGAKGKVYLVGAGPGDPGLITQKGVDLISQADVIVYDRLANPNLLIHRKPGADLVNVGKLPHVHWVPQDEIEKILVREARAGKLVVRLKGGDPYVFGRGGEEGESLHAQGVPFEVVPGISSSIGGLAYAGIPITYREEARSFHVITGHRKNEESLNYSYLAHLEGTLVFLMGFANLQAICQGLVEAGKDPKTPAALVMWAATPRQRMVKGDLSNLYDKAHAAGLSSPALICIGEVVNHQDHLDFTSLKEDLPFIGKNFLLFRQAGRSEEVLEKLEALGGNAYALPTIQPVFHPSLDLDYAINHIDEVDWIFLTSANGVDYFMSAFLDRRDIRDLAHCRFLVVGSKTRQALASYGLRADLMPKNFIGTEAASLLAQTIQAEAKENKSDKQALVLAPRSSLAPKSTMEPLKEVAKVKDLDLYDLEIPSGTQDLVRGVVQDLDAYYMIFSSSSTFRNLRRVLGEEFDQVMAKATVATIGPTTSKAIRQAGYPVDIQADKYTIDGVIEKIKESLE